MCYRLTFDVKRPLRTGAGPKTTPLNIGVWLARPSASPIRDRRPPPGLFFAPFLSRERGDAPLLPAKVTIDETTAGCGHRPTSPPTATGVASHAPTTRLTARPAPPPNRPYPVPLFTYLTPFTKLYPLTLYPSQVRLASSPTFQSPFCPLIGQNRQIQFSNLRPSHLPTLRGAYLHTSPPCHRIL